MAKNTKSARKRLALDEIDQDGSRSNPGKQVKDKSFEPNFERPNTRLNNGIQVPKRINSPETKLKPVKKAKIDSKLKETGKSFSNDNGSNSIAFKPDPSKYVLTCWGDVTVLGKRKLPPGEVDDDQMAVPLDDGIVLSVQTEEEEELDYHDDTNEPETQNNSSSDEEAIQLGATATNTIAKVNMIANSGRRSTVLKTSKMSKNVEPTPGCSTTMTEAELKLLQDNPHMHLIIEKMVEQRFQRMEQPQNGSRGKIGGRQTGILGNVNTMKNKVTHTNYVNLHSIKSPSDTTIYVPAISRQNNHRSENQIVDFLGMVCSQVSAAEQESGALGGPNLMQASETYLTKEARERSQKAILDAEKNTAVIVTPPTGMSFVTNPNPINEPMHGTNQGNVAGPSFNQMHNPSQGVDQPNMAIDMNSMGKSLPNVAISQFQGYPTGIVNNQPIIPDIGSGLSDDDFFHLTCHIKPSLIQKIEKGEFVELEKLLPKERSSYSKGGSDENRLEWVQRDGSTFLVSVGKEAKITGIRRWEQAFRAYATIYCAANPQRSKEIWQYVGVINTVAAAYSWDNVYNYDITFRHLMAFNPNRSWAVTYNQMWNLSMRDPLPKVHNSKNQFQFHSQNHGQGNRSNQNQNNNQGGKKKGVPDYCWNFNKGIPCKFGRKCTYMERCKYCDSPNHGVYVCPKLKNKRNSDQGGNTSHHNSASKNDKQ